MSDWERWNWSERGWEQRQPASVPDSGGTLGGLWLCTLGTASGTASMNTVTSHHTQPVTTSEQEVAQHFVVTAHETWEASRTDFRQEDGIACANEPLASCGTHGRWWKNMMKEVGSDGKILDLWRRSGWMKKGNFYQTLQAKATSKPNFESSGGATPTLIFVTLLLSKFTRKNAVLIDWLSRACTITFLRKGWRCDKVDGVAVEERTEQVDVSRKEEDRGDEQEAEEEELHGGRRKSIRKQDPRRLGEQESRA